ncbi:carboxymuconolactone decarboxylase family protein [Phenylobacterium sp.]|uniref:carboxymuconolactone decarboxylase family protein n=1 Tax=Phenylobacterium sp. TaxID=1871053 RepID=UPI0027303D60|nr:carboxymuconolactone decarboxylase family protein [Phenylobacterium sp.]MDP1597624.1 carboxymuconolactone decarboxylase family protein [Phenylobacterium sp.]MDP3592971.1 carboxymuconolactone decarboxylase family protein [Phenylobacterium sp.]
MSARLNPFAAAPEMIAAMTAFETAVASSGLEHSLIELVKTRASQINGCAFCLHMHTRDARAAGESEERLHLLAAWWESSLFTPREKAALTWTESLTLIAQTRAPDADYAVMREEFDEAEAVKLTMLIGAINVWNRLAVGFRSQHPRKWSVEKAA